MNVNTLFDLVAISTKLMVENEKINLNYSNINYKQSQNASIDTSNIIFNKKP